MVEDDFPNMEIRSTWSRTRKTRHDNCELGFFLDYRLQTRPIVSGLKIPWDIVNSVSRFSIRKHLKKICLKTYRPFKKPFLTKKMKKKRFKWAKKFVNKSPDF